MKVLKYIVILAILGGLGYLLVTFITSKMNDDTTDDEAVVEEEDTQDEEEEDGNPNDETEEEDTTFDFDNYSDEDQSVGEEDGDTEYTLTGITNESVTGFHRFTFSFESDDDSIPYVQASLISSGGYIRVVMNNVTEDNSGIDYNSYETIDEQGITRLYHDVTANETEEVYNIGISSDTIFYLYDDGTDVILDVKYPGASDSVDVEDSNEFTTGDVELQGTNAEGDVRIVGYSWGVENGAVKFIWETSSASGNPTPDTNASYDSAENEITVTFTDILSDSVLGQSGSFELPLSKIVDRVVGARDVMNDVFIFELNGDAEYRIYRETSPNQVVIEIR